MISTPLIANPIISTFESWSSCHDSELGPIGRAWAKNSKFDDSKTTCLLSFDSTRLALYDFLLDALDIADVAMSAETLNSMSSTSSELRMILS